MRLIFINISFLVISINLNAQNSSFDNFKSNESISYCITSCSSPNNIVRLDNNWDLLIALRTPKTIKELDSIGIKFSYSQLELLKQWKLIRVNNKMYQTNIIILDSLETSKLRICAQQFSIPLTNIIKESVQELINVLANNGRQQNTYSILFSYVLDGIVWRHLEDKNIIKKRELTIANPLWDGEFWTLYPKRDFYCGTNSLSDKGYSIKINWSEKAIPIMRPFISRSDLLEKLINDFIENGKITDKSVITEFSKYGLFDKLGNLTIPVIIENESNPIYSISEKIVSQIVNFLEANINMQILKEQFGFLNNSQTTIILYHEILWELLIQLEKNKIISKPKLFEKPNDTDIQNVSDLIFITKK